MTPYNHNNSRTEEKKKSSQELKDVIDELYKHQGEQVGLFYEDTKYINILGTFQYIDEKTNQAYFTSVTTGKGKHMDDLYADVNKISNITKIRPIDTYKD
ncbi:MAG: hypothetical protein ACQESE_02200 [Nanobdellota archaeon]